MDAIDVPDDRHLGAGAVSTERRALPAAGPTGPEGTEFHANRPLQAMIVAYGGVWSWSVVDPVYRGSWILENMMTIVTLAVLVVSYRRFAFSNVSYLLIFTFLVLHAAGGHYTYAGVPLGRWLGDLVGAERNHYDRLVHLSFGLLWVYPLREIGLRLLQLQTQQATLMAVGLILAGSAGWEIVEWLVVCFADPTAAQAFLAMQGDHWDAQKDMALAGVGAVATMTLLSWRPFSRRLRHSRPH